MQGRRKAKNSLEIEIDEPNVKPHPSAYNINAFLFPSYSLEAIPNGVMGDFSMKDFQGEGLTSSSKQSKSSTDKPQDRSSTVNSAMGFNEGSRTDSPSIPHVDFNQNDKKLKGPTGGSSGTEQFQTSMQFSIRNVINSSWKGLLTQEREKFGFNQDVISSGLVEKLDSKQKLISLEKKIKQEYSFFKDFLDSDLAVEFYGLIFVSLASILRVERCRLELEALEDEEEEKKLIEEENNKKYISSFQFQSQTLGNPSMKYDPFSSEYRSITPNKDQPKVQINTPLQEFKRRKSEQRNKNKEIIEAIKSAVFEEREEKKRKSAMKKREDMKSRSESTTPLKVDPKHLGRFGSLSRYNSRKDLNSTSRSDIRLEAPSSARQRSLSRSMSRGLLSRSNSRNLVPDHHSSRPESRVESLLSYEELFPLPEDSQLGHGSRIPRQKKKFQDSVLEAKDQLSRLSVAYSHILSQYRFPNDQKREILFYETLYLFAYKIVVAKFSSHPVLNSMIRDTLANLFRTDVFHRAPEDRMRYGLTLKSRTITYMQRKNIKLPKSNIYQKLNNPKQRSPLISFSLPTPDVSVYNIIGNPKMKKETKIGLDIPAGVLFQNIAMENEIDDQGNSIVPEFKKNDKKRVEHDDADRGSPVQEGRSRRGSKISRSSIPSQASMDSRTNSDFY